MIAAVIFDLDGVLLDSEQLWDEARREVTERHGGTWRAGATAAMQGMSAPEWSRYLHEALGVDLSPTEIDDLVVGALLARYRRGLPLVPGAVEAVRRVGARWPLALASSSNREVIDMVLDAAGLVGLFGVVVSSEEVPRGKPAPDVYLEAARRLGQAPTACAAVEDSANGIRAALASRLRVVAVPNPHFPPPPDVLDAADLVLRDLEQLSVAAVEQLDGVGTSITERRLDEEEAESFPASDPHADWAGPPD